MQGRIVLSPHNVYCRNLPICMLMIHDVSKAPVGAFYGNSVEKRSAGFHISKLLFIAYHEMWC